MAIEAPLISSLVQQVVELKTEDAGLPGTLDSINLTLNRKRLAEFVEMFWSDSDVQDFLLLDLIAVETGAEISSTGEVDLIPDLSLRPFRLWEYIWLYKVLRLFEGGNQVLDLGGPASHIVIAAALAGNSVHSVDLNPRIVTAGRQCAEALALNNYRADVGDMCDLSSIASNSVNRIVCCSVLEHLTASDQKRALSEMARVLAPGGVIGLTFDYGAPAPGVNIHLPPPHEPPETAQEVRRRYVHSGLEVLGGLDIEDPVPGSLFQSDEVSYTMGSLFLGKPPLAEAPTPVPVHRKRTLISGLRIPDLMIRLQEKARRDVFRAEATKAFQQAAEERLRALEDADKELRQLYTELERRADTLLEMKAQVEQHRSQIQQAHTKVSNLHSVLDNKDAKISHQEESKNFLESQVAILQEELLSARREVAAMRGEDEPEKI